MQVLVFYLRVVDLRVNTTVRRISIIYRPTGSLLEITHRS